MTFGPESEEVGAAIEKADAAIGQLLDRLTQKDLWPDKLNLIVTGTPGYATLTPNHLIDLSAMIDPKLYLAVGESPVLNIRPLGTYLIEITWDMKLESTFVCIFTYLHMT